MALKAMSRPYTPDNEVKRVWYNAAPHVSVIRIIIYLSAVFLTLYLIYCFYADLPNTYQTMMSLSGQYSLIYFFIVLAITPLRRWCVILCQYLKARFGKRLSDWNWLIKLRRSLGVVSTHFALMHVLIYLWLELDWFFGEIVWDAQQRPVVAIGWLSFLVLTLLALTSPDIVQKKLKKNWRVLHRSIYPLTLLILLHYALEEKIGESAVVYWVVLSLVLLLHRVWFNWRKVRANVYDDGMVAKR